MTVFDNWFTPDKKELCAPFFSATKMGIHQNHHHVEDAEKFVRLSGTSQSEQNQHRQENNWSIFAGGGGGGFPPKMHKSFFIRSESTVFDNCVR
jgi:hypothetical protein